MSSALLSRSDALAVLREPVATAARRARRTRRPVLFGQSFPLAPPANLVRGVARLRAAGEETFLWERGTDRLSMAGIGQSWCATASGPGRFREIAAARDVLVGDAILASEGPRGVDGPIFFGAFSFDPEMRPDGPWHGLPASRLVLPRLLVVRRDRRCAVTLCAVVDPDSTSDRIAEQMADDLDWVRGVAGGQPSGNGLSSPAVPIGYAGTEIPTESAWKESVSRTIEDIARSRIEKLVLTRTCRVRAPGPLDCARAFERLRHAYPSCATFWVGTRAADFVGATPEVLVGLEGRIVRTSAVAGSVDRGTSPEEDEALCQSLVDSEKDRHEHEIVVRAIEAVLRPLCERLWVGTEPEVLKLANVQHLLTPISGRLGVEHDLLDLVERLHPTPAVAGFPPRQALAELRAREGLDRGWYAGPLGWIDADGNGEFSVAIRSALVRGSEALLYAGAGIVAGSDPEKELEETRLKLRPLIAALTEAEAPPFAAGPEEVCPDLPPSPFAAGATSV